MPVRIVGCMVTAVLVGISIGIPLHARADEPETVATVTRPIDCSPDSGRRHAEADTDGEGPRGEPCPVTVASIPVVRTPPVLVAPTLEPISPSRRVVKKGVAPEVLEFLRQLHGKILEVREYPLNARKLGLQGIAMVKLNLMPDGNAQAIKIRKTSGHSLLDEAALEAVQRVLPLKPPPEAGDHPLELNIPIGFTLR